MITSSAPGPTLDTLRRLSGPNPEGSKLTDAERLHLIFLLGALVGAIKGIRGPDFTTLHDVRQMLIDRGLSDQDVANVINEHEPLSAVALADALAVHPSLKSITDMYLD